MWRVGPWKHACEGLLDFRLLRREGQSDFESKPFAALRSGRVPAYLPGGLCRGLLASDDANRSPGPVSDQEVVDMWVWSDVRDVIGPRDLVVMVSRALRLPSGRVLTAA